MVGKATNPEDGLRLIHETAPHVALVDILCSGRESFDLASAMAAVEDRTRIVFLTGHLTEVFVDEAVRLGVRGYLSKFFPLYEFRKGIAAGIIAMFVGFIELFLEFIKPVTLSMRLFGNIFGGEVALGVVTGLFITLIPVALYGLEVILTFIQALIFSTLTLMFILAAIESHHHEEGHMGEEAVEALEDAVRHAPASS